MHVWKVCIRPDPEALDRAQCYVRAETIRQAVALIGHPDVNVYALPPDVVWPGEPGEAVCRCG